MLYLATTASKLIAGAVILAIIVIGVLWLRGSGTGQLKQDVRSADAQTETALESAAIVIDNAKAGATVDQLVAAAAQRIEDAPTPEVAAIEARSAICSFPEYAKTAECQP